MADDRELADDDAASGLPCFNVNRYEMNELRDEMRAHGMLTFLPEACLAWHQGDEVGSREIRAALAIASERPATAEAGGVELWREWLRILTPVTRPRRRDEA